MSPSTDETRPDEWIGPLASLAAAADHAAQVLVAAEAELGRPLGLVGPQGEELGHAPDDQAGRRAVAVARDVARRRAPAPAGWRVLALPSASPPLGFLAAGTDSAATSSSARGRPGSAALLADQLRAAALRRAQRTFVRRLTADPHPTAGPAERAPDLELPLAERYWPALLAWHAGPPAPDVVAAIEREAQALVPGALVAASGKRVVLLHPGPVPGGDAPGPLRWFEAVVSAATRLAPGARPEVVVGEGMVELDRLRAGVAELDEVLRFGPRAQDGRALTRARQFALERLLCGAADAADLAAFVQERLGRLVAWDTQHHTSLLVVLEAALDFPRQDQAASRCFMHRNTFRHRLRQAIDVLDEDLDNPDLRLAVHVALKLRRLVELDGAAQPRSRSGVVR
jgi:hypothetical protein